MNRPGPVGFTLFVAFALVAAIELRTVLSMLGLDVASAVYFPVAAVLVVVAVAALYLLTEEPRDDEEDPHKGNPSEA